jgi:hypothetical protein
MRAWAIPALLAIAYLAGGCENFNVLSPERSGALLKRIHVGMSEAEVIDQLGKPQRQEVHGATKFFFYRTTWQLAEEAKWRNPIAFRDGKVVGFGKAFLEHPNRPAVEPGSPSDAWQIDVRPLE